MTHHVAIHDLDGSERIADLPWSTLHYSYETNAPGAVSIGISIAKVTRADVEPGQSNYRVYQDATPRAAGRLWNARVDPSYEELRASITGEGTAGILTRRLIDWERRYEPLTEVPSNINTDYGLSQEEILWDLIERSQAEPGGDLAIVQGTHDGASVPRRRWYCAEDGLVLAEIFDDFAKLSNGIDWAITPTLSDPSLLEFATWNPSRGADRTSEIVLDGTTYLDTLAYEIDAGQIVSRGHSVAEGDCDPPMGDATDAVGLADYGLLEAFDSSDSDLAQDAQEVAVGLLSPLPIVSADLEYQLSEGPALGTYDIGDLITVSSPRPGWEFEVAARVEGIGVTVQLPDDEDHTFVRVTWSQVEGGS